MKNFTCLLLILFISPFYLFAQLPSGIVAKYPLDGSSATDASGNGHDGTLTSVSSTTNRFGTSNTAIQLTSGTSYGTIPVVVKDNFTVGFWMKTSMSAAGGSQWYSGNSLIDAEVCGVTNDWGIALINGGKICFGIGNPDKTIISSSSYNDNNWHFVTATRDESSTGTIILYVDGSQVATTTGVNTSALSAPTFIGIGRNNCTGANYTGSIDDLIFYGRTLTSTEVTNLYSTLNTVILPLSWISFTGLAIENKIQLQWQIGNITDDYNFEIEHSSDGKTFSSIGTLSTHASQTSSFLFNDAYPANGVNYYRIKQIEVNGSVYYSPVIMVAFQNATKHIGLQSNPVFNNIVIQNPTQQLINELRIVDVSGRIVTHKYINSQNTSVQINATNLPAGFYFIVLSTPEKNITLPVIKAQ